MWSQLVAMNHSALPATKRTATMTYGVAQKVSHYQEPSLNCIKTVSEARFFIMLSDLAHCTQLYVVTDRTVDL